jgi:hypothetical protein
LTKNSDVFAWSTSDLIGVSRDIIEHKQQVNPNAKPRKQKYPQDVRRESSSSEGWGPKVTQRMLHKRGGLPSVVANVVIVRKKNGKCQMCTDFTDINKCCPEDDFPL